MMAELLKMALGAFGGLSLLDALIVFMLITTRWLTMGMIMPILGAELLPSLVRISMAMLFSAVSFFVLISKGANPMASVAMPMVGILFLKEALIGLVLGFLSSLVFYAYEMFGQLIDLARAASMSKMLVPELKDQSSAMGSLCFQFALATYLSLGFHRSTIEAVVKSFDLLPISALPRSSDELLLISLDIMGPLFAIALRLSLPVIFISFLIDLGFGIMNRVAPQINAYFLSLPAKMIGGLAILFFLLPFLLDDFHEHHRWLATSFHRAMSAIAK